MNWVIDMIMILAVIAITYVGYVKGITKMLVSFLVIVLSLGIAYFAASPLAEVSYDHFFAPSVSQTVDATLENAIPDTIDGKVEEFLENGPIVGGVGKFIGFDLGEAWSAMKAQSMEQVADFIKNDVIRPPMVLLIEIVLFILLFFILWIVLFFVAKSICKTAKNSRVKGANAVFGGLVGFVLGVVVCLAIAFILDLMIAINPQGILGITQQVKDQTYIYQLLSQIYNVRSPLA